MILAVTHNTVDVAPYEEQGHLPAVIIPRTAAEAWYVRCLPLLEVGAGWEWNLEGTHLRVPLFPYIIRGTDPELAITFGVQLGLQAMWEVAGGDEIVRVHLAVGYPTEDCGDHLRYWMGVAVLLRQRRRV